MPVWTAADVVGFLPAIPLNVSFFKEQGERREAACAERQPKCGGKIIARFGVVRRAWGCGRHGSRYGCGSCRRCRRWFRCGRGCRFCGWGCRGLRCRRGRRFCRGVAVGSAVGVAVGSTVGVAVGSGVGVSSGAAMVKVVFSPSPSRATDKSLTDVPEDEGYFTEPVTAVTL